MKVIHFTHTDLDGVACSIVANCFFKNIETHVVNWDQIDSELTKSLMNEKEQCLYIISDLSYSQDNSYITDTLSLSHFVIVADHHKTALWLNEWNKLSNFEVSVEADGDLCGAEVLFNLLSSISSIKFDNKYMKDRLCSFLQIVSEWDTWNWSKNLVEPIHENLPLYYANAFSLLEFDKFKNRIMRYLQYNYAKTPFIDKDIEAIDNYNLEQERNIEVVLFNRNICTLKVGNISYRVLLLKDTLYQQSVISLVANKRLPKDEYRYDLIMIEEPAGFSLRYGGDIDLSKIAEYFGGGGHYEAAGFPKDKFDWNCLN
jgi:oligoribonuclease NrnB/cAMP/cGMP phosphodiesterase (DHH superfamily)